MLRQTIEDAGLAATRRPARPTLGLIGVGAFGQFILPHLVQHFDVTIADAGEPAALQPLAAEHWVRLGDVPVAAGQDVVVLAVPLAALEAVGVAIAPHVRPGALVVDVCSLKGEPMALLRRLLPASVHFVGTHPLFGPASGAEGLAGLRIAVCAPEGERLGGPVCRFLRRRLSLEVIETSAEEHDRQMAQVQALTHLLSRVIAGMDLPRVALRTRAYEHLMAMVANLQHDSEDLFRAITVGNPMAGEVIARFLDKSREVAGRLA